MTMQEIKQKTNEDLRQTLLDINKQLQQIRFGLTAGRIKNVKEGMMLRRIVARIKTIMRERP